MPPRLPMSRQRPKKPEPPARKPVPVPIERSVDFCRVFVDGKKLPGNLRIRQAMEVVEQHENAFVWLSLKAPSVDQMEKIAETFDLDDLIVDDIVDAHQRPKIDRYDEQLFMVVRSVHYRDDEEVLDAREIISTGEVQVVAGPNFAITIRHNAPLPDLTGKLEEEEDLAVLGPSAVAWVVADYLTDNYLRVADYLSQDVDELENEVFTPRRQINIDKIYNYKREILEMRHAIDPLAPALRNGLTNNKDLVRKALRSYFRDVQDNATIVSDRLSSFDERLTSLLDASVAKVSMQQNADMRTISAVVGMAAAPTMIAGIYGMNFEYMPELGWKWAYPATLLVMLLVMGAMLWWFRRNNWL
ncbi:magnesium and cobalt transport protein CorA [Corynebacterium aquatimens]|uniref:magnesium and cobalt transport protein CorA n=1 Tax=Corynebacterium TaxID=1716 RepID=UPI001F390F8F|nr:MULTISPECIES: magnesium and cobalt transport protein CorA [Corynebacterium]QYH19756.1 magnesium and cobalt transport protein CorA [Corynebacterium aquatimens]UIZ93128.1 magnesium and cobalt transport protein CorA [Corynebacterium sp. CNCTC7651]